MHISYKPLWHTLLERDMRKEDLRLAAGMTTNMIANMSDRFSVSFDFGACPGILKYVSQKHVFRNKNKNPFLYQVKGLYT